MTQGDADIHTRTARLGAAHLAASEFEGWMTAPEAAASAELRMPAGPEWSMWRRRASKAPRGMQELIVLQAADGSWELTRELATIIGRDIDEVSSAITGATGRSDDVRRAWATALAVAWLELRAAGAHDEWQMLYAKARTWLDNTPAVPPDGRTWLDFAREFLKW
jgi:hypothetical protein